MSASVAFALAVGGLIPPALVWILLRPGSSDGPDDDGSGPPRRGPEEPRLPPTGPVDWAALERQFAAEATAAGGARATDGR